MNILLDWPPVESKIVLIITEAEFIRHAYHVTVPNFPWLPLGRSHAAENLKYAALRGYNKLTCAKADRILLTP
jgi:hypothetical protein